MAIDVFVSVGRTASLDQEQFVEAVERLLLENDLTPRRAQWSSVQPLIKIEEVLSMCHGTVIIAFERLYAEGALELRGGDRQKSLSALKLPTVWNQIEAVLAYSRGHPMLVLCEEGLRSEGFLEKGYDWNVHWTAINKAATLDRDFQGILGDWRDRVRNYRHAPVGKSVLNAAELSVTDIIGSLKPAQLWTALASFITLLAAVAGLAFKLGSGS